MKIAYICKNSFSNTNLFKIVTKKGKLIAIGDYRKEEPRKLAEDLGYILKGEI